MAASAAPDVMPVKAIPLILRQEWEAMPPMKVVPMQRPIERVLYSVENNFAPCTSKDACMNEVKKIQMHYMDKGMDDMPYNFVVGNDGNMYEGRGWNTMPGNNIQINDDYKDKVIDIGVITGHSEITPENCDMIRAAFKTADEFVAYHVATRNISENYEFDGFSDDVKPTGYEEPHPNLTAKFEDLPEAYHRPGAKNDPELTNPGYVYYKPYIPDNYD